MELRDTIIYLIPFTLFLIVYLIFRTDIKEYLNTPLTDATLEDVALLIWLLCSFSVLLFKDKSK